MAFHFHIGQLAAYGEDVRISENVVIKQPQLVKLGSHVAIDDFFYCTTQVEIGDYVHISPFCSVIGGKNALLKMDHFSGFSAGCRVAVASDEYLGEGLVSPVIPAEYRDKVIGGQVVLEKFATLGTNVVIMPGITIGEGSIVGAGGVVTKDTEPWTIYVGIPAKPIKVRKSEKMKEYARRLGYDV